MKKNVAGQKVGVDLIKVADGLVFTGTARVAITIDGGVQDTTPGGTVVNEGRGFFSYDPTQAETNGDHIAFTFDDSGALAVARTVQVYTTFPQTVDNDTKIDAIPTTAMRGTDGVDTATMRGTDSALTDKAGFSLSTAGILAIWHQLTAAVVTASTMGKLTKDNLNAAVGDIPTTAMRGTDGVDTATMRGTDSALTDKAGFSLAATGLDLVLVTSTFVAALIKGVWDRVLNGANHNITNSSGRRLRILQESGAVYGGQIYVDTLDGTAGTTAYENGTSDNHVLTIADAKTLSTAVKLPDFHIINGSTILLFEDTVNESYFGDNWNLQLGIQDVSGGYFQGANVTGIGTATMEVHFQGCEFGTASIQDGHFDFCAFDGTLTFTLAGDYNFHNCYSKGDTPPVFTKTAGQAVVVEFHNYSGDITVSGLEAGDSIELGGNFRTIVLNGVDATVHVHGHYEAITDNRTTTGARVLSITGATKFSDSAATLLDTDELQTDWTDAGRLDALLDAVKAKTDPLTFTKANEVDANAKSIDGTTVLGDGGTTPWGP